MSASALRFLIDQDVSPTHVARLAALGCFAEHVAHIGMSGYPDSALATYAFEKSSIIITKNVVDFIDIAEAATIHPGIVLLRDGALRRLVEWSWIEPVVRHLQTTELDPINKVIDVTGVGAFALRDIPALSPA